MLSSSSEFQNNYNRQSSFVLLELGLQKYLIWAQILIAQKITIGLEFVSRRYFRVILPSHATLADPRIVSPSYNRFWARAVSVTKRCQPHNTNSLFPLHKGGGGLQTRLYKTKELVHITFYYLIISTPMSHMQKCLGYLFYVAVFFVFS